MKSIYTMSCSELKSMRVRLLAKSKLSGVEQMYLDFSDFILNDSKS